LVRVPIGVGVLLGVNVITGVKVRVGIRVEIAVGVGVVPLDGTNTLIIPSKVVAANFVPSGLQATDVTLLPKSLIVAIV